MKPNSLYDLNLEILLENFTFVTDSAVNMPRIVGSSVSTAVVPTSEWRMPWSFLQLNIVMKHVIGDLNNSALMDAENLSQKCSTGQISNQCVEFDIQHDLKTVKEIVFSKELV